MNLGNELVCQYRIDGREIDVYGCWDGETPENEYDFYDIYDQDGICLNEGDPWFEKPTEADVEEYLTEVRN